MSRAIRRIQRGDGEAGAYAILYAALIVIFISFAALVVDIASVRADRRTNRAAADAAAIAAVRNVDSNTTVDPHAACETAWDYLVVSIHGLQEPAGACDAFNIFVAGNTPYTDPRAYCLIGAGTDVQAIASYKNFRVIIGWPVAQDAEFLHPDLAPGNATQAFNSDYDGDSPCQRVGVAVDETQQFGLAGGIGFKSVTTQNHSVARVNPSGGPDEIVAALNVLNPRDCGSLITTGSGEVIVGPTVDADGNPVPGQPGTIAVESDATGTCGGSGSAFVIDPTNGGALICASSILTAGGVCDGLGTIKSHRLDVSTTMAYNPARVPTNLRPRPIPEGGTHGWDPVTEKYGCVALPLSPSVTTGSCVLDEAGDNYIKDLSNALLTPTGSAPTSNYNDSKAPYTFPAGYDHSAPWSTPAGFGSGTCTVSGTVIVPVGNIYLPCTNLSITGTLILRGGTIVLEGGLTVQNGGCLVVNTPVSTCAQGILTTGTGSDVSTLTPPAGDAIFFMRNRNCSNNCGFTTTGGATLSMPQTFVFGRGKVTGDKAPLSLNGTGFTLWTAPGSGPTDGFGRTVLEERCYDAATDEVNQDCLNSRFSRLTYWSEYPAPSNPKTNTFNGQGSLNVVGVFFTPKAYFNFTGGSSYAAASAQFWADILNVNGGAFLGLLPDERFAIKTPTSTIQLIR